MRSLPAMMMPSFSPRISKPSCGSESSATSRMAGLDSPASSDKQPLQFLSCPLRRLTRICLVMDDRLGLSVKQQRQKKEQDDGAHDFHFTQNEKSRPFHTQNSNLTG